MSDQGNNYKKEVMEALDTIPANKLSGKAYRWVATNLPDEGKSNGVYSITPVASVDMDNLNHDQKKVSHVFGYSDEKVDELGKEFEKIMKTYVEDFHKKHDDPKKSHFIWFFIKSASPELQFMIYMNCLAEIASKMEDNVPSEVKDALKSLEDLLKKMKKDKGE